MTSRGAARKVLLTVGLAAAASYASAAGPEKAADEVTLRDGGVVRGEIVTEVAPRSVVMLVRRDWARAHLPRWVDRWSQAERTASARAVTQRRHRLTAWRHDRVSPGMKPRPNDRITAWIDAEIERLEPGAAGAEPLLMTVRLGASDFSKVTRRPKGVEGLLREGWRNGFKDPEGMTANDLRGALQARGLDPSRTANVSLEGLLPPPLESESVWLRRRAATEVSLEPELRFVRYQGILMPDTTNGGAGLTAVQALPTLTTLLGGAQDDPLPARLRSIGDSGRSGAMVTSLSFADDFSAVTVQATLFVREGQDRWSPAGARVVRVRPEDLGPDAGKSLRTDPQVAMALQLVETVGLKEVPEGFKQRALNMGAATQKALADARTAAEADLARLAFPVLADPAARPGPPDLPAKPDPEKTPEAAPR